MTENFCGTDANSSIDSDDIDVTDPSNHTHPHRSEAVLRHLYYEQGLTQAEIAERLDVCQGTVCEWMDRNDISTTVGYGSYSIPNRVKKETERFIYPTFRIHIEGNQIELKGHQLAALIDSPVDEVFGEGRVCHHRLPSQTALNVAENVETMSTGEHQGIVHPDGSDGNVTPEEADTASTLDDIGWEQSGVPADAARGLHGSQVILPARRDDGEEDTTAGETVDA
jgi:hypothetical protein